jgi:hypothetical protein
VLGIDYWSYGTTINRPVWDALSSFLVEQRLAPRKPILDELFVTG